MSRRRLSPPAKAARASRREVTRKRDPVHIAIERESRAMWALYERTGAPAPAWMFPAVVGLYEHVLAALVFSRSPRLPPTVSYAGRSYPVETTSFGRLRVLEPGTRRLIVAGGIGALW